MADAPDNFDRYRQLPFRIELELGRIALGLESVLKLQEGDVLHTTCAAGDPLRVLAGGVQVALADLVIVKGKPAARIVRIGAEGTDGRP